MIYLIIKTIMSLTINVLCLFSGTKSLSKTLKQYEEDNDNITFNIRTLDFDKKFSPDYCVDILKFDYEKELSDFNVDYLHCSPVCCQFSQIKTLSNQTRDLSLGYSLLDKSIEICNYLLHRNPDMIYSIENPRNKYFSERCYRDLPNTVMNKTSYCKYGFPYQKVTMFFSNIDLELERFCSKTHPCKFFKEQGYHDVVLCYPKPDLYPKQRKDSQLLKELKQSPNHDKIISNLTRMRYRIPKPLFKVIIDKVVNHQKPKKDLVIVDDEEIVDYNIKLEFDINIREIQDYQDRDQVYQELDVMSEYDYGEEEDSYERYNDNYN